MGRLLWCCWSSFSVFMLTLMQLYVYIISYGEAAAGPSTLDVLLAFRKAITQDPTQALAGWESNSTTSSSATSYCSWEGVVCDASNPAQVNGILLPGRRLEGTITPMIGNLAHLSYLNLSHNSLSGSVPSELGSCITMLELSLNDNELEGPLPAELNNLTRLQIFSASNNALSGRLPQLQLPALQQLNLSFNTLEGELTSLLPGCSGLSVLDLSSNRLEGPIPDSIGNLSRLANLELSSNNFTSVSPFIGNCTGLTSLNLGYNLITGSVPSSWFDGLSRLSFFTLASNQFTGPFPSNVATLSLLQTFDVQMNRFEGQILQYLLNCSSLTLIYLHNNTFSERIPTQLGSALPHLTTFVLELNHFYGPFPVSLGNCSNMEKLQMGFNHGISGHFPNEILGLQKMQNLDLQWNLFVGELPAGIGNLSSALAILILNDNNFTGRLPPQFGLLRNLQGVTFEHNQFSGSIPQELGNCTNLLHLIAHDNLFSGPIPSYLGHDNALEWLQLQYNQLSGSIPASLSNCTRLSSLLLNHNLLEGSILQVPLPFMLNLDLSNNRLSGPIPPELISSMFQASFLDLSFNNLSGSVPPSLANCVNLFNLNLSSNQLTGSISTELGVALRSLVDLNLSHNYISGPIPSTFANLTALQALDLSFNSLSGSIPAALTLLANLSFFNVSYNSLEGELPETGSFRFFTAASFLGNPRLCGSLLHVSCRAAGHSALLIVLVAAGSLLLLVLLAFVVAVKVIRGRKLKETDIKSPFLRLSLEEILKATDNFSPDNLIGSGGTSNVYKGTIRDGRKVAFKKMHVSKTNMIKESSFLAEIKSVGQVRHRNLVKVLGYYSDLDHDILFLDYMENGNLSDHLHGRISGGDDVNGKDDVDGGHVMLPWNERLQIANGIAAGLAYLHHGCPTPIIHMDVKPTNILLDDDMNPRISDFGLARVMQAAATHESTQTAKGSLCYMAPEYASFGNVSTKCDVYSYGIVLLEIVTGRSPTSEFFNDNQTLSKWANLNMQSGDKLRERFVCVCLGTDDYTDKEREEVILLLSVALLCTKENPKERPTMDNVIENFGCASTSFHPSNLYKEVYLFEESKSDQDSYMSI